MKDLETGSLWSHILGEAMQGPMKGKVLKILPGVVTTWSEWKKLYPKTSAFIMPRKPMDFRRMVMEEDGRYVYGVRAGMKEKAYYYEHLEKSPVLNDSIGGSPVLITHSKATAFTRVFSREYDGKLLEFKATENSELIQEISDDTIWDARSGIEIAQDGQGRELKILNGIVSFSRAWKNFFPESSYSVDPSTPVSPVVESGQ